MGSRLALLFAGMLSVASAAREPSDAIYGIAMTEAWIPMPDGVRIAAIRPSRLLVLAGAPLREPIVQYGPFVMTSTAEVRQAIEDFTSGRFAAA